MDCERFDDSVMDALYGELDELSAEALKRHVDGCARCSAQWASLKATRAAIQLPVVEPSDGLTHRILEAEGRALRRLPWHRKVVRAAAWAGSHAMRPQLAMAALFMFVIGSSMMLLRARPGTVSPPVTVRDEGRPGQEDASGARRATEQRGYGDGDLFGQSRGPARASKERADDAKAQDGLAEGKAAAPAAPSAGGEQGGDGTLEEADQDGGGKDAQKTLAKGLALKNQGNCEQANEALRSVETEFPGSKEAERAKAEQTVCAPGGGSPNAAPSPPPTATGTASAESPAKSP